MVSMAIQNHLALWLVSNQDAIPTHGADAAYHDLRRKRAEQFTLETALENFDRPL